MKIKLLMIALLAGSTSAHAVSDAKVKGRWYTLPYDLTKSVEDNPIDWARYERDTNKWRDAFNNSKDGKASTLTRMVNQSPGCVLLQAKGDHVQVWSLEYEKRSTPKWKEGYANRLHNIGGYSDSSNAKDDGKRKTAYDDIWMNCGMLYGTAGKSCVDIYGVSLCSPF